MHSFAVHRISETGSTNTQILELAKTYPGQKIVLSADYQTKGRGQFGRQWQSQPRENLLFSIYFCPAIKPADAPQLTPLAAKAVMSVLSERGISCMIKPPNDILVNRKKICGILTEASSSGEKLDYVIVGIGLNVNSTNQSLLPEATSMKIEIGKIQNRDDILEKILHAFENEVTSHFGV